ncbi:MAG: hypothetical protein ACAH59_05200 [Pseudobdellovibrionaceae bacterium]
MQMKFFFLMAAVVLAGSTLSAQVYTPSGSQTTASDQEEAQHLLAGHRYLPSIYFPNPLAVPTFEFDLGFGSGSITRDYQFSTRELKLGTLGPKVEAQIKIFDRLVVIAGIAGNIVMGLDNESIAFYGASAKTRPRLGLLYQITKEEHSAISFGMEWEKPQMIQASPVEALSRTVESALGGPDQPLTDKVETDRWRPTLRGAYAFNPAFGLSAFLGMNVDTENFNNVESESSQYLLGASFDADFKPLARIPVGFSLTYRYSDRANGDGDPTNIFTMGIFETFSNQFNAGIEVGQATSGSDSLMVGSIVTRYYY